MAETPNLTDPFVLHAELEPVASKLLERHQRVAKEWYPHELVPYSEGRTFGRDYVWDPSESAITDPVVSSALYVNLLTEDNLPYYFREIDQIFGADGAFGEWTGQWTAEEGRHSLVIRDYLHATRAIDPKVLERGRMAQVRRGEVPHPRIPLEGIFYVALQELATKVAHSRTGKRIDDPAGKEIMDRVARDENLHFLFYKDLGKAALEVDPSGSLVALEQVISTFTMPGTGITNFEAHSEIIAIGGIYGATEFKDEVLGPMINTHWNINALEGLNEQGETARAKIHKHLRRAAIAAALQNGKRSDPQPHIEAALRSIRGVPAGS